ncbi:MAG: hypothetical protein KDA57_17230 [Planctomycetales bacterium]|nr:hypothetical protein [Planctomycetales bacterium]
MARRPNRDSRVFEALGAHRGTQPMGPNLLTAVLQELEIRPTPEELSRWASWREQIPVPSVFRSWATLLATAIPAPRVIVEPVAGVGVLIATLARKFPKAQSIGICQSREELELARLLDAPVQWKLGDPLADPALMPDEIDWAVGLSPLGQLSRRAEQRRIVSRSGRSVEFSATESQLLAVLAASRLTPTGRLDILLRPADWELRGDTSWRHQVQALGLHLDACLALPKGSTRPFALLDLVCVSITCIGRDRLFVGEIGEGDSRQQSLLDNYQNETDADNVRLGRWVESTDFQNLERLAATEEVRRRVLNSGLKPATLGDLATSIRIFHPMAGRPLSADPSNTVFIRTELIGRRPIASLAIGEEGPRRPVLVVEVDRAKATPEYLVEFFNSELGRLTLLAWQSGGSVPRLLRRDVEQVVVYLPPVSDQVPALNLIQRLRDMHVRLHELEVRVSERPDLVSDVERRVNALLKPATSVDAQDRWEESLPFPLATIYRRFLTFTDPQEQREALLHFFEAYAQYWAIVLLSGFMHPRFEEVADQVRAGFQADADKGGRAKLGSMKHANFRTWIDVAGLLSKAGRKLVDRPDSKAEVLERFALPDDADIIGTLFGKTLLPVLSDAATRRNDWHGHAGVTNPDTERNRVRELQGLLTTLREHVGESWGKYRLYQATSLDFERGVYRVDVKILMGAATPFHAGRATLMDPITVGNLFVTSGVGDFALQLCPLLRLHSQNGPPRACYFYNRIADGRVRWVSYHHEPAPDLVDAGQDATEYVADVTRQPDPKI